jgi:hypothetical protein
MILRRYGQRIQSVRPNFDPLAITEVGFLRDNELALRVDEFEATHEREALHELTASHEGDVQVDVETVVLKSLEQQLLELESQVGDRVLVIENEQGVDPARARGRQTTGVVGHENRYHFAYTVDPPLKVGVYRRSG